jgi:hypothetical protein
VLATAAYLVIASLLGSPFRTSDFAFFNYQADAFLHGQIHLAELPATTHDLAEFQGRYYLYWLPFPAVVALPFVAVLGIGFSDILLNMVLGGLNAALVATLLRRATAAGVVDLEEDRRGLLVAVFALGSVQLPLAVLGRVWFTAQLVGFTCAALAYLAAVALRGPRACLAVGTALACAVLTRSHLLLAGVWPAVLLFERWRAEPRPPGRGAAAASLAGRALLLGAPIAAATALVAVLNLLRFGDPFDAGIRYQLMDKMFRVDFERFGAFSLNYLPTNLYYHYVHYPLPFSARSLMGGSLFLLTPVFAAAAWAFGGKDGRWSRRALLASIVLTALPSLLLMGTGWRQWGPRYTLDFTVPLLVLVAGGLGRWPTWAVRTAALISVAHYVAGAIMFGLSSV